jgi:hypothetical protein
MIRFENLLNLPMRTARISSRGSGSGDHYCRPPSFNRRQQQIHPSVRRACDVGTPLKGLTFDLRLTLPSLT